MKLLVSRFYFFVELTTIYRIFLLILSYLVFPCLIVNLLISEGIQVGQGSNKILPKSWILKKSLPISMDFG